MPSSVARLCLYAPSVAATHAIAAVLARLSRPGDVVVLAGEMGAGKTAFAQGFGQAIGVTEPITSPTFTIVHTYAARMAGGRPISLHHADVYRLEQFYEVAELAFGELAEFDGVVLVEWGDVVAGALGDHLEVLLEPVEDEPTDGSEPAGSGDLEAPTGRRIAVSAGGQAWATRWAALSRGLGQLGLASC